MKKQAALCFGILLGLCGLAQAQSPHAQHPFRFLANYERVLATNSASNVVTGEAAYRLSKVDEIWIRYKYDSRKYKLDPSYRADHIFSFGTYLSLMENLYTDLSSGLARSPKFSPNIYVDLIPHYVLKDETDLGLGLKYRYYRHTKDVMLAILSAQRPILSESLLVILARGDFVLRPKLEASGSGGLQTNFWKSRIRLQGVFGGGKSYEGGNLVDRFWTADFLAAFKIETQAILRATYTAYRGKIRDENRVGGGFEVFF